MRIRVPQLIAGGHEVTARAGHPRLASTVSTQFAKRVVELAPAIVLSENVVDWEEAIIYHRQRDRTRVRERCMRPLSPRRHPLLRPVPDASRAQQWYGAGRPARDLATKSDRSSQG
jgi:hypothetical protein